MTNEEITVHDAPARHRYEIHVGDDLAGFTSYTDRAGRRTFFHTEIDERFAGRGLASKLIAAALAATRTTGHRIVATCPFVAAYLAKHHDFDDITDPATTAAQR